MRNSCAEQKSKAALAPITFTELVQKFMEDLRERKKSRRYAKDCKHGSRGQHELSRGKCRTSRPTASIMAEEPEGNQRPDEEQLSRGDRDAVFLRQKEGPSGSQAANEG